MPKSRPPHSPEWRRQLVELVRAGRNPKDLARKFEPTSQLIRYWVLQAHRAEGCRKEAQPAALSAAKHDELARLCRENKMRRICGTATGTTAETAYDLLSIALSPDRLNEATRSHWGIGNQLHWRFDVIMDEDQRRTRLKHGPETPAVLRHMALNVIQAEPSKGSLGGVGA